METGKSPLEEWKARRAVEWELGNASFVGTACPVCYRRIKLHSGYTIFDAFNTENCNCDIQHELTRESVNTVLFGVNRSAADKIVSYGRVRCD